MPLHCFAIAVSALALAPPAHPNLLKAVDLGSAGVKGHWTQTTKGIVSDTDSIALVRVAAAPRGEYDLKIQFTRQNGTAPIGVILSRNGADFALLLGGADHENASGFDMVNGHRWWDNASTTHAQLFKAGDKRTLTIKVRNDSLTALLSNKKICDLKTDLSNLSLSGEFAIGPGQIGLVTLGSSVIFHSASIESLPSSDPNPREHPVTKTSAKQAQGNFDPMPVGSKWSGTRTEINRSNQFPCKMKVIERSGNSVTMEITEKRCTRRWTLSVSGRSLQSTSVKEVSGGVGVINAAQASGAVDAGRVILQYQWYYSDRKVKNAIVTGTIELERDS